MASPWGPPRQEDPALQRHRQRSIRLHGCFQLCDTVRSDLAQLGHESFIFQADGWGAESWREGKDQPVIFYVMLSKALL